jgi:hypothetical protein
LNDLRNGQLGRMSFERKEEFIEVWNRT